MGLFDIGKRTKLTIEAYEKIGRTGKPFSTFEAMFNPPSFSEEYEIQYSSTPIMGTSKREAKYTLNKPSQLKLKLILDDTGVMDMGLLQLFGAAKKSIADQVKDFLKTTYWMNGSTHEPSYLKASWGNQLNFNCRLSSVNITYVNFDSDGNAKRAELDIVLISDEETQKRLALEAKSSPDLTHSRIVKNGDTLPLLCKQIYGSSQYYIRVAEVNNLDDFRNLIPGQELIFPPLDQ